MRRQRPKMDEKWPRPSPYGNDFRRRLNELKQTLKPSQNKHSTEYISKITRSSRLPRHMDRIEEISSESSCRDTQSCLQNVVDTITPRGVLAKYKSPQLDMMTEDLSKMFNHADFNISMMANNKINHININSSANKTNIVNLGNISLPAISASEVSHMNIDLSANKSNTVSCSNISCPAKAVNEMNHVNNGLSAYYNNKVNCGKTESSDIVTNKLKNMQL
ncbi:uncharacterized protein LOC114127577 [Aphis gossypii]|uniref:Uncharacterized protein n=1 Tax=Aphis gossypii TaxID=80765 RepID=A0A9P0J8I9_APHGO|nr:uncharacterized protein LOC114127577 [Aphis gossypii]XP_050063762.1 uncharacterized protein LOC114127577 [Aphis gossypii]XP_050063763.1 uncharacterized protein LOC114127577 [Aphis gossypii]CAH1731527.1 unnamed protein product [Aphis gossypii]